MGEQQRDCSYLTAFFRYFGGFCSRYPVEVFVTWLTTFACFLTLGLYEHSFIPNFKHHDDKEGELYDTLTFGSASYVLAISYLYLRCKKLLKEESLALVGMTILHIAVSSLVFFSALLALFGKDWRLIREALPFCLLLIDIKKVNVIEKLALSSSSLEEVRSQIAEGAGRIGPTLTLNTIVEAFVILIGAHSGIKSIEVLCIFSVVAVIVNFLVSISFVPAALSLYLELHQGDDSAKPNQRTHLTKEAVHVPNPVVQQVKIIMSLGLVLVHLYLVYVRQKAQIINLNQENLLPKNSLASLFGLLSMSTEQVITATLSVILAMKYIFESDRVRTRSKTDNHSDMMKNHKLKNGGLKNGALHSTTSNGKLTNGTMSSGVHSQTPLDDVSSSPCKAFFQIGEEIQEKVVALVTSVTTVSKTTSNDNTNLDDDSDEDILNKIETKVVALHQLENKLTDLTRAVKLRRQVVAKKVKNGSDLSGLPYESYDYSMVIGSCCENVIGYMPIPVGVVGPLLLDGRVFHVPMATVEGCLVASTNRGCRALAASDGVRSRVIADGMTRGPAVRFPSALQAGDMKEWLSDPDNFDRVKKEFDSTSRFARLQKIQCAVAGRLLFLRFQATTGDAMGMNMISKGTERSLTMLHEEFPEMEVISISGNYCTDKKAAAVNWIEGRGKSVVCEAIIPADVVRKVLKTTVSALVEVNINKNLVGSALAGALGGFNAHAANIVTAVFIATGQDAAQNVSSSQCMTLMEKCGPTQEDLYMSCTMPSVEVGTVGGGTVLPPQAACLEMLGIVGPHDSKPGENAAQLARVLVGTVLAGELSLLSALAAGHLVKSHMKHNRSNVDLTKIAKTCLLPLSGTK